MTRAKTEFKVLQAYHGDSILIKTFNKTQKEFIILIDGGTAQTFKYSLKKELQDISKIDLLILTHIDSDHISGLISFFKNSLIDKIEIGEIWMNNPNMVDTGSGHGQISVKQGNTFQQLILDKQPKAILSQISTKNNIINRADLDFYILSPTPQILDNLYSKWKEKQLQDEQSNIKTNISSKIDSYSLSLKDLSTIPYLPDSKLEDDVYNASSIAFLLKCPDVSILLLADSRPEVIVESLKRFKVNKEAPLEVDYVKVSHHGSLNNTSQELLSLINCNKYLISTNGGSSNHKHPSRETIARLVYNQNRTLEKLKIYFNYPVSTLQAKIGYFINDKDLKCGNWESINKNKFEGNGTS